MLQQNAQNTLVRKYDEHRACKGIYCVNERIGSVEDMVDLLRFFDRNLLCTF
jgi:hypothetical protein